MRLAAGVLLGLTAACGTTVPYASQQSAAGGASLSGVVEGGTAADAEASSPAGADVPAAAGPGAARGSSGGAPGGNGAGGMSSWPAQGGSGRPLAEVKPGAPVEVGFFVAEDLGPFLATAGLKGLSSGNGPNQVKAATALLNASGGLAGHPVKPVVFELKSSQGSKDSQAQAACNRFFTDHKTVAVVSVFPFPILQECSRKQGVPFVSSLQSTLTAAEFARYPNIAIPDQFERSRGVRALIPGLVKQGYFRPRGAEIVKVGLLTQSDPAFAAVPGQVRAELRQQGIELSAVAAVDVTDGGTAQSSSSSAVLTFQTARVTHVILVEDHGGAMTFFLLNARSQGYYPRLGLSSYEIPQIAALVLPAETFKDATGIGWLPSFDVLLQDADKELNAPARACLAGMRKQGEDVDNSGSRSYALGVCDAALALQAAWRGRPVSLAGFQQGLAALRGGYTSTIAPFGVDFTGRRDGASAVRPLRYDTPCTCFRYTGPPYRPR